VSSAGAVSVGSAGVLSVGSADAFSVGSTDAFLVGTAHASKGKLPVEPVSLARRSKRLEGARRQYVVVELFPGVSDTEGDGVECCSRGDLRPHAYDNIAGFRPSESDID
jgi:hypothetical protein